jgi:hypothetical protein
MPALEANPNAGKFERSTTMIAKSAHEGKRAFFTSVTFQDALRKTRAVRGPGKSYKGYCPAHNDRNPSLSLKEGRDGKLLLKCFAGCDFKSIMARLRDDPVKVEDDPPPRLQVAYRQEKREPSGRAFLRAKGARLNLDRKMKEEGKKRTAKYLYDDAQGKLVALVCRYDDAKGKTFRPISKWPDGWHWCDPPGLWPLYNLDGLKESDGLVFVTEGEKACGAASKIGLAAVTSAHGAKSAGKTDWTPLAGREVIILPDNDKSGREYAQDVAEILMDLETPATVKILDLEFEGRQEGDDIVEWIKHHKDKSKKELVELFESLVESDKAVEAESPAPPEIDPRPEVNVSTDEFETNSEAVKTLVGAPNLYQRGESLVRIVKDKRAVVSGIKAPNTPRIAELPQALLRELLTKRGQFVGIDKKGNEVLVHPPAWCVAAIDAYTHWPQIPFLDGVIDFPILKPDGSILAKRGYDPETALYLSWKGKPLVIPENPTRNDAVAAVRMLLEVVVDFPFEKEAHKSAWVASVLTLLARYAFEGPAPLFLIEANTRGAGKGLLANCISNLVTGENCAVASYTNDEAELDKRITAIAIAGYRVVLFDNLTGQVGNGVLDRALTTTRWEGRILGVSRMYRGPLAATWLATGNNPIVNDDTCRRICPIRLETTLEKPELRTDFVHPDLLTWIRANRRKLLKDALTILRAFIVAGRPDQKLPGFGSFDGWSTLVRKAVVWAGMTDPGEARIGSMNNATLALGALLRNWKALQCHLNCVQRGLTAARVLDFLRSNEGFHDAEVSKLRRELQETLDEMLPKADARSLGNLLRAHARRNVGGLMFECLKAGKNTGRWVVRKPA